MRTWYVASKESSIKRVMIEVFPTPWSPSDTSLYLLNGGMLGKPESVIACKQVTLRHTKPWIGLLFFVDEI